MAFLVFEGLDGSGKTSLIQKIREQLTQRKIIGLVSREPGGTPLGEELRQILLRRDGDIPLPRCELLLYEAIRAQHVDQVIRPALSRQEWILCDRFIASSIAFQVHGRQLQLAHIEWLNQFATAGLDPDLTILLDLPLKVSLERRQKRFSETGEKADRFESEAQDFHERVRQSYLLQARKSAESWLVLDATLSTDQMVEKLLKELVRRKWLAC
jgi:dTMP kinase